MVQRHIFNFCPKVFHFILPLHGQKRTEGNKKWLFEKKVQVLKTIKITIISAAEGERRRRSGGKGRETYILTHIHASTHSISYTKIRQHNIIPTNTSLTNSITHVILAFMPSSRFTKTGKEDEQQQQSSSRDWPLFDTVENVRGKFTKGTKIMVAIGGWGDTRGFEQAAISQESRLVFAENVRKMVEDTGADGKHLFPPLLLSLSLQLLETLLFGRGCICDGMQRIVGGYE